jgi:hypothetical protein
VDAGERRDDDDDHDVAAPPRRRPPRGDPAPAGDPAPGTAARRRGAPPAGRARPRPGETRGASPGPRLVEVPAPAVRVAAGADLSATPRADRTAMSEGPPRCPGRAFSLAGTRQAGSAPSCSRPCCRMRSSRSTSSDSTSSLPLKRENSTRPLEDVDLQALTNDCYGDHHGASRAVHTHQRRCSSRRRRIR